MTFSRGTRGSLEDGSMEANAVVSSTYARHDI